MNTRRIAFLALVSLCAPGAAIAAAPEPWPADSWPAVPGEPLKKFYSTPSGVYIQQAETLAGERGEPFSVICHEVRSTADAGRVIPGFKFEMTAVAVISRFAHTEEPEIAGFVRSVKNGAPVRYFQPVGDVHFEPNGSPAWIGEPFITWKFDTPIVSVTIEPKAESYGYCKMNVRLSTGVCYGGPDATKLTATLHSCETRNETGLPRYSWKSTAD